MRLNSHRSSGGWLRLAVRLGVSLAALAAAASAFMGSAFADSPLSWSAPVLPAGVQGVGDLSCPSTTLCIGPGVGVSSSVVVSSSNPTGGAGAWSVNDFTDPNFQLAQISCASESLCVIGEDFYGEMLGSTNPTGGASTWTATPLGTGYSPKGLSCPMVSLCVAGDAHGTIYTSTDPGAATPTWTHRTAGGDGFMAISCPATSDTSVICVAVTNLGNAAISADPTGSSSAWQEDSIDSGNTLLGVSCPSAVLCVAVDNHGNAVTFDPSGPLNPTVTQIDTNAGGNRLNDISCPSTVLCVAVGDEGVVVTSTNPTGGAGAWSSTVADSKFAPAITAVSCPSTSLCVASDNNGLLTAAPVKHSLTVTASGTAGSITGTGISCPGTCSGSYSAGTQVTLTATAGAGSVFSGWSGGGCSGSASTCTVTMDADETVTGTFSSSTPSSSTHTLKVVPTGSGTVTSSPTGISCGAVCAFAFTAGNSVTLTAQASLGSQFAGWGGACSGSAPTCTVTMSADQTVTALFKTTPPNTQITRFTVNRLKGTATFHFRGSGGSGALHFACKLDKRRWASCRSAITYTHLKKGKHVFAVEAIDAGGTADPTPATKPFRL